MTNNFNESPLTLALKRRGFWKTAIILLENGAIVPNNRVQSLQQYLIDNKYVNTFKIYSEIKD